MAARQFQQFQYSLEKKIVTLYAKIPIGNSGAVGTLVASQNQGIYSVTRAANGQYTISFGLSAAKPDKYQRCLFVNSTMIGPDATTASTLSVKIVADNSSSGSITIGAQDISGGLADPPATSILLLEIKLKNSSI